MCSNCTIHVVNNKNYENLMAKEMIDFFVFA